MGKKNNNTFTPIKVDKTKAYGIISICFWLVLWELLSRWVDNNILIVSPLTVCATLLDMMKTSAFYKELFSSMGRILGGFLGGLLLGFILSTLAYKSAFIAYLLKPIVSVMKSTPVASFIILVLIWVGSSYLVLVIALLTVFPVIYSNVYQGYCQVDKKMLEMGQIFRLPKKKKILYIYLPSLMPYLLVACNLSLGLCWKAGIAAEVIGIPAGSIGAKLYDAKLYFDTNVILAWTIVIIVCSVLIEKVFLWLLKKGYRLLGGNLSNDRIKKGM